MHRMPSTWADMQEWGRARALTETVIQTELNTLPWSHSDPGLGNTSSQPKPSLEMEDFTKFLYTELPPGSH